MKRPDVSLRRQGGDGDKVLRLAEATGARTIGAIRGMGKMTVFLCVSLASGVIPSVSVRRVVKEMHFIGVKSLFIIVLTGLFSGMVLGLQGFYTLGKFAAEGLLGAAVALSLIRELGPVLTALMVTGRAGSAMTAEIGIMRIREQIDALEAMGVDPVRHLVSPRLIGGLLSVPLLTAIFDVVGILGGYVVGVDLLGLNRGIYFGQMEASVALRDIADGFLKSVVFGLTVSLVCTYKGFFTERGAEGVGRSTTSAVVLSSVLVLVADYILTSVLL